MLGVFAVGRQWVRLAVEAPLVPLVTALMSGFPSVDKPPEAKTATWEIHHAPTAARDGQSRQFVLRRDGADLTVAEEFATIAEQLMWHLTRVAIDGLGPRVGVHAGVVARAGDAVMLPAVSGSGKTTLTAALVTSGWAYLSDELAILDGDHGHVTPFARPACMTPLAVALIPGLADRLCPELVLERLDKLQVGHNALRAGSLGSDATVRTVVFPRYESGAETVLERLRPVETLARLLPNAFNLASLGQPGLDVLAGLCRVARGYRLVSGDLGEAVEAVEQAVDAAPTGALSVSG